MADVKPLTKTQIQAELAERTELSKKDIGLVMDTLEELIAESLAKKGPGVFTLPGLLKVAVKVKPATPARKGINPRTGDEIDISAKPARKVVKVTALKKLKEMAPA